MNFRENDPGAVQYGNFINYYNFHPAEDRLQLFPTTIWQQNASNSSDKYLVLDVGCNSGNISQLLYTFLKKHTSKQVVILGIDIDPVLIERAREANLYPEIVSYECMDIMTAGDNTFKGYLQINDKRKFDAVFCLSITMWIHLNHGDKGLQEFLQKTASISELFILEPQPWKCYRTAVKRLKHANDVFEQFKSLEIRMNVENEIQRMVIEFGLEQVFETIPTKWDRKICFYRHKKI